MGPWDEAMQQAQNVWGQFAPSGGMNSMYGAAQQQPPSRWTEPAASSYSNWLLPSQSGFNKFNSPSPWDAPPSPTGMMKDAMAKDPTITMAGGLPKPKTPTGYVSGDVHTDTVIASAYNIKDQNPTYSMGRGPGTTDCSKFVADAFSDGTQGAVKLPAYTDAMFDSPLVAPSDGPQQGALVFFQYPGSEKSQPGVKWPHVGLVTRAENGHYKMIDASSTANGIVEHDLDSYIKQLGATGVAYRTVKNLPAQNVGVSANTDTSGQRTQALAYARSLFGEEGARVLDTTFNVEGGWDRTVGAGTAGKGGPLQFAGGGELNNFAKYKGITDLVQAGDYARSHPLEAVTWALNGYYGQAIRAGMDADLRGASLAEYVQMKGQRSAAFTAGRAYSDYQQHYGTDKMVASH